MVVFIIPYSRLNDYSHLHQLEKHESSLGVTVFRCTEFSGCLVQIRIRRHLTFKSPFPPPPPPKKKKKLKFKQKVAF